MPSHHTDTTADFQQTKFVEPTECSHSPGLDSRLQHNDTGLTRPEIVTRTTSIPSIDSSPSTESNPLSDSVPSIDSASTIDFSSSAETSPPTDITVQDLYDIWSWNATAPEAIDACVHDLISTTIQQHPESLAIDAWDGKLTYRRLDELSTRLAHQLVEVGVGPNTIIPLCFEKSMWMPVAMLAVMKAGGASVGMDMTQPEDWLRTIIQQINPPIIVASSANQGTASGLANCAVLVAGQSLTDSSSSEVHKESLAYVPSSSLLYLVFTSGSTGTPKGVKITHSNWASALHHQRDIMGFDVPFSRVYDFSSYSFDVAWSNLLHTLVNGACLCIPSDEERKNNLAISMERMKVTVADLTPTTIRLLKPSDVPTLKSVLLIGEKLQEQDIETWSPAANLKNIYGPSECTTMSTGQVIHHNASQKAAESVGAIGRGIGMNAWIVDEQGHSLVPIGTPGELWLEGPLVGTGYLDNPEKTAAAFIEDPPWLLQGCPEGPGGSGISGRRGRLYRTGDLVRYNKDRDGTLTFISRIDTQVKIRGQRVELGEIEHHVHRQLLSWNHNAQVVAEMVAPENTEDSVLAAFVSLPAAPNTSTEDELQTTIATITAGLNEQLARTVPSYKIPSVYIAVKNIPRTASGKTDRKRLRELAAGLSRKQLAALNHLASNIHREPTTVAEKQLQALWAKVLKIDASTIKADDNFLLIGDSIQAMQLVRVAHENGLSFTVADIFRHPRLSEMAKIAGHGTVRYRDPEPFSLVDIRDTSLASCLPFSMENCQDIYPVTDTQRSCIDAALLLPPQGCYYFHADFPSEVGLETLVDSCEKIWNHLDILRTAFFDQGGRYLQAVAKGIQTPLTIYNTDKDLAAFSNEVFEKGISCPVKLGEIFPEFLIFHDSATTSPKRLALKLSHAHFDGVSMELIQDCLSTCMKGQVLPHVARFSGYMKHVRSQEDATLEHWKSLLEDSSPLPLFQHPKDVERKIISSKKVIEVPKIRADFTQANVFIAACASTLAKRYETSDVVFSLVVSGRTVLPAGLHNISGPCLNIIPMRIEMDEANTLEHALTHVHQQRLNGMEFEHSTISNILKHCTDWPQNLRKFTYTVLFQLSETEVVDSFEAGLRLNMFGSPGPMETEDGVLILAMPVANTWEITVSGNAKFCDPEELTGVLDELVAVLQRL